MWALPLTLGDPPLSPFQAHLEGGRGQTQGPGDRHRLDSVPGFSTTGTGGPGGALAAVTPPT